MSVSESVTKSTEHAVHGGEENEALEAHDPPRLPRSHQRCILAQFDGNWTCASSPIMTLVTLNKDLASERSSSNWLKEAAKTANGLPESAR